MFTSGKRFLAAVATVLLGLTTAGTPVVAAPAQAGERTVDFDHGWRFALVNTTGADAPEPAATDSSWRSVDLPHDWSIGLDPTAGPNTTAGTGYLPGGLGWYRKTFTLPSSMAGKKLSIEFDGVYMDSSVYFNGKPIGTHAYGYTGFNLDLTALAHTDGHTPNVLDVKVRNQVPSSRWYSGSGIYRDVHLVATDPVHIARHGTFVTTPNLAGTIKSGYATVHVDTTAVSESGDSPAQLAVTVRDAAGRPVTSRSGDVRLGRNAATTGLDLRLDHPNLWSTDTPYLYTVDTTLSVGGRVVDETSTTFGVRWFTFDADQGFSLNGTAMKLHGVDMHHDLGALGSAIDLDAVRRQMRIMKSMGVNALRTSHNPPSPQMLQVCEELGIVVMDEAFDTWRTPKVRYDYGRFFDANSDADVTEMVNAAKNSPAVVMWSIGNEIPDSTSVTIGVPIAKRLIADVRAADPTRPIVMGSDKYRTVPANGSAQDQILRMLDGLGLNYNTAASVDALHAKYPTKFLFESESSSETSTRGAYDSPDQLNSGENYTPGRRTASSYDNNLASWTMSGQYSLKKDRDRRFFAGQFLWSGFDYIGEPTPFDDVFPVKSSFFGAVDTAGFPKDQYYLFRSQWSADPMVHLVPMNWTDHRPGEPVTVWAYSNADTVELYLNGKSLGVRKFDQKTTADGRQYLETTEATGDDKTVTGGPHPGSYTSPNGSAGKLNLTWTVPFAPGQLVAVAKRGGVEVARDELRTAGAPAAIRLSADRGSSLSFVTAEVVDANGVTVPDADNELTFHASGGQLVGLDNGQQESAENYQSSSRAAFNGKALAMVRGPLSLTVTSPGLLSGSLNGNPSTAGPAVKASPGADASFSGAPNTLPAAMLDGVTTSGGWSNYYSKAATALLPAVSKAHASDWVSESWSATRRVGELGAYFTVDAVHSLPASIQVSWWDGRAFVPVTNPKITWAAGSDRPTRVAFDPVSTTKIRLDLASSHPGAGNGFLQIAELTAG
ncbi:beta-galactosidase [Kutzneria sp. 744]|nr:beta-galactosidase [Kutzneria sp. 744]